MLILLPVQIVMALLNFVLPAAACAQFKNNTQSNTKTKSRVSPRLFSAGLIQTTRNLEAYSLVWLTIDTKNLDVTLLRKSINYVKVFHDFEQCEQYIKEIIDEKITFIVSDSMGQNLVPRIHDLKQVNAIYVFCFDKQKNKKWTMKYTKIKGVYTDEKKLIAHISQDQEKREKYLEPVLLSFSGQESSHTNMHAEKGNFLWSQLLVDVFVHTAQQEQQRNTSDLVNICREQYRGNQTEFRKIDEFERTYTSSAAVKWYTKDCCFYRLLNKALRVHDLEVLIAFKFFIVDIFNTLNHEKEKQLKDALAAIPSNKIYHGCPAGLVEMENYMITRRLPPYDKLILKVYRGQAISKREFAQLRKSAGNYISLNSFISTTEDRKYALGFITSLIDCLDESLEPVLIEIYADLRLQTKPFANVAHLSHMHDEREVLFMLGSVFRLDSVTYDSSIGIWIVKLTLCSENNENSKQIYEFMKKELINQNELFALGLLLKQMGEYSKAKQYFERLLNDLSSENDKLTCLDILAGIAKTSEDYTNVSHYYQTSLRLRQVLSVETAEQKILNYNKIGEIYCFTGEFQLAFENYRLAISICGHDRMRAICLNNVGRAHRLTQNYKQAIENHHEARRILRLLYPLLAADIADTYRDIAQVYTEMKKHELALENYQKVLKYRFKALPPGHPDRALAIEAIGIVHEKLGHDTLAIPCYTKSAEILRNSLPSQHPEIRRLNEEMKNKTVPILTSPLSEALNYKQSKSLTDEIVHMAPNHPPTWAPIFEWKSLCHIARINEEEEVDADSFFVTGIMFPC
ncbi:unnamed protein product, partial [Didymodactylos carnosus]